MQEVGSGATLRVCVRVVRELVEVGSQAGAFELANSCAAANNTASYDHKKQSGPFMSRMELPPLPFNREKAVAQTLPRYGH